MNDIDVYLVPDGIKKKGNVYDFSKGFAMFVIGKNVTEHDIKCDENNIKQLLRDINYKQRGDSKSNRSKLIKKRILASMWAPTSQVAPPMVFPIAKMENTGMILVIMNKGL